MESSSHPTQVSCEQAEQEELNLETQLSHCIQEGKRKRTHRVLQFRQGQNTLAQAFRVGLLKKPGPGDAQELTLLPLPSPSQSYPLHKHVSWLLLAMSIIA